MKMNQNNKIWICSDWHFNHDKPFVWQYRGFSSVEEMNQEIIRRHNEIVSEEDEVYILGDCCMGSDLKTNKELISCLHGQKYFIIGNHCTTHRVEMYKELGEVLGYATMLKYKKYSFYLSHYPSITGNFDYDKPLRQQVISLCGHSHTQNPFADIDKGLIYHCELDSHNCYPILLDDIIEEMKAKNKEYIEMVE